MVATRSLQLTVKKTARTQKTLEGQLLMIKDGERTAVSSRVAELDQIVPQYLGVSRAILDAVIFCHQDESLWPMSEPSVLKKKFDEIFEALKYTKAIDNIKALRKKQNEELGKYKIMEQAAKDNKDKADKAEKKSRELSDEIEALRVEAKDLHQKAQDAGDTAQEAWNKVATFTQVVELLKAARRNQEWHQRNLADLGKDLKERNESDEWLQSELDQYEERMKVHERHQSEKAKRYDEVRRDIGHIRKNQDAKRVEAGKHEERKAAHEQKIRDRDQEIKRSAREHGIKGYDTELDEMQISEYMDRIAKLSKDQNTKVERLRRDNAKEISNIQSVLDNLRERRSALQEGKKSGKEQMVANDRRIASFHSELESIGIDEGGKATLESDIEDLEEKIKKAKRELLKGSWESKIQETNSQLRALEDENASLNREFIQSTKQAGNLASLNHLKKELQDRRRSLETMKGVHGDRIRAIVGQAWEPSMLEADFQSVFDSRKREVTDAERQRDGIGRDLEQVDFKLQTKRGDIRRKEKELEGAATAIRDATQGEPDDYPENLAQSQSDRDTRKYDVDAYAILKKWYSDCIETANSKQACRLCQRSFEEDKARRKFISGLERQVSKAALEVLEKELKELDEELHKARDAGSSYDTWIRLSEKELPTLRADVSKHEEERENLLRQIEEYDIIVNLREEARRDAETLTKPIANISKYSTEILSLEGQIRDLVSKQQDTGHSRTLEDIQEQIESIGTQSRTLRNSLAKLQADEQRSREQMNTLELDLEKAKSKLITASHELEKRGQIVTRIDDLKKSNQEQRDSMSKLDRELHDLAPQFAEEEARRDDVIQRANSKEKELQQEAGGLIDSVRILHRADQEIKTYVEEGGLTKLKRCQREIQNFEQEIIQLEAELKQITVEINKIREELANHDQTKRVISDNLKYRKTQKELDDIEKEIAQLSTQNAEVDQENHRRQAERWQRQHKLFSTEETSKMGIMKAKDDQLLQLLEDWNTDYKDAALKYKESHIHVEVSGVSLQWFIYNVSHKFRQQKPRWRISEGMAAHLTSLYYFMNALQDLVLMPFRAIMKYHSIKMEEINRIVEELWKRTYQGTDVDTILIRSDNETGKGNRSYNYRVCMVKQDVEMDMRGRCSAGQKVLASIIIRLALAECFGVNCGLIALDEPTTNLDRDNIRSLAESLHDIIKARQQQSNFQLIVITHDEDFLRYMKCADFCDNYYRVSRSDRQKSIIERQSIAEVM